jgi:UDP-2,3-diacylglucosamine hydrolase
LSKSDSVPPERIGQLAADPRWRTIDLLSDVHLHQDMPRTFDAWSRHLLQTAADAVLMLGDLFEVWVGDDARHQGFEHQCAQVLRAASARRVLAFMPGNRDFLVGQQLLAECGVLPLADPTVLLAFGQRWLLTHGDALCLADRPYQRFRAQVRDPEWQRRFLEQPLPQRQAQARAMREASETHQAGMAGLDPADVDDDAAADWLRAADAAVMVHGHTHRPATHALADGRVRHVMGDWDFDGPSPRARMLRLTADGLQAMDLANPLAIP